MKKLDIALLIIWVIVPPLLLLLLKGNFFISCIFYLLLPSIYFSIRSPGIIKKALLVSFAIVPCMVILDYIAFFNKTWAVPTVFPFRFFQFIPLEDFIFTFFAVYTVITSVNYFFKIDNFTQINKTRFKTSGLKVLIITFIFLVLYKYEPNIFTIPYYYFWLDLFAFLIPTLILIKYHPAYRKILLWAIPYSFILMLPYEITANYLGLWTFPSEQYLGMVNILNQSFPIEELFAWMILFLPAFLAFMEFMTGRDESVNI